MLSNYNFISFGGGVGWHLFDACWAPISFFGLQGGSLFRVGAFSRLIGCLFE